MSKGAFAASNKTGVSTMIPDMEIPSWVRCSRATAISLEDKSVLISGRKMGKGKIYETC